MADMALYSKHSDRTTIDWHHVADMTDGDTKITYITYNTEITLITAQCMCDYLAHIISHPT